MVGAGKVQGTPDTLTANVSIEFIAPDVTSAMNQTSERQQAVINALVGSGMDRKDISTTQVSLQPQYAARQHPRHHRLPGEQLDRRQDPAADSASQALALIVSTGGDATRINSVNYSIEDDSQLVKDARARAFEDAKDRAEQYAELSGLTWARSSRSRRRAPDAADAAARCRARRWQAVPLEPGQQTVGFSVTVVWELT